MQLQLGDRLTDASGEFQVIGRAYTTNAGKDVHARVQRVDNPDVTMIRPWGAHERIGVSKRRRSQAMTQRLGDRYPCHYYTKRFLACEEMGLSLADQDVGVAVELLTALYQTLRRVSDLLRSKPYGEWQPYAVVAVPANGVGKVPTTLRAQIGAFTKKVCGEVCVEEADVAGRANGDGVVRAKPEDQRPLFRCQAPGPFAVKVRQTTVRRLHNVGYTYRPEALCAIDLHCRHPIARAERSMSKIALYWRFPPGLAAHERVAVKRG
jgi:hypothetical protein